MMTRRLQNPLLQVPRMGAVTERLSRTSCHGPESDLNSAVATESALRVTRAHLPGKQTARMAKKPQNDMDIVLQQQQEAERKRQEYISLKEKEAELQRISEEKRRIELEQKRKLLNEKREKMIEAANIRRENDQRIQDQILEEKERLDYLRSMKRDTAHNRVDDDLIFSHSNRDSLSTGRDFYLRSVRRVFVLLDVDGDGIISKVTRILFFSESFCLAITANMCFVKSLNQKNL